jgi:type III restriction enzyme
MSVEIKFDGDQVFQIQAINSVVDLFEGANDYQLFAEPMNYETIDFDQGTLFNDSVTKNTLEISRDRLISNLASIQERTRTDVLGKEHFIIPPELRKNINFNEWPADFSVEMETGTGKTYVYLRTALELNRKYGLLKFVIVVPSTAIREGVLATLRQTKEHFSEIFSGVNYESFIYDSKNLGKIKDFATSKEIQFLVINISSFNRDENLIRQRADSFADLTPLDFIRAVNPIVILDEPQKLSTEIATSAIESLNPLFRLRYSATHIDYFHLVYRLSPIDAYQLKLVKRIDVLSVTAEENRNTPYVEVKAITGSSKAVTATLIVNKAKSRTQITVRRNTDLFHETNLAMYEGWIVEDIHIGSEDFAARVEFSNGRILRKGSSTGVDSDLLHRLQMRAAIEDHFDTELRLKHYANIGVISPTKPLTLFFIDRVVNYGPHDGKYKTWFEEEYEGVASLSKYRNLIMPSARDAHRGYFASTKLGFKDSKEGKGNREDEEAFDLIMRKKEVLLSFEEPVRFIFSHSALAEGWDNPNVFTICNFQESNSDIRRRQQIGRGLRLPVMANGERCRIEEVNHLTIVATETFEKYALGLQKQLEDETGIVFKDIVRNKRDRVVIKPKVDFENTPGFRELWDKISLRTKYHLDFSTDDLVNAAVQRLKGFNPITDLKLHVSKQNVAGINHEMGVVGNGAHTKVPKTMGLRHKFPDILKDLSNDVPISRSTIRRVILESGRLHEAIRNPAEFVSQVRSSLYGGLAATLKDQDGIKYERREPGPDSTWQTSFFTSHIAESYEDNLINVTKSIFDRIPVDSIIERKFAEGLEAREDVDLFLKLPSWFKIDTPVGGYNPDWAIVRRNMMNKRNVYLVRETKGSANLDELFRESEVWKVTFGRKHFDAINVDYKVVKESDDLDNDEISSLIVSH